MNKILVTDTLFIFDEHVQRLRDAGYEVVRIEKPDMTEAELVEAVSDKVGYILGGIEYVTDAVVEAAANMQAIIFTGTGFKGHIPGWKLAQQKGIKIGNTPYANVYEVAEWALAATLAMQRDLFSLGPQGSERFHTITSLPDLTVGVIGLGHIGKQYADMLRGLGAKEVCYWNRTKKEAGYSYKEMPDLLKSSDIIFVALADDAGQGLIRAEDLKQMKQDALLVSISHHGIITETDLAEAIRSGHIRAAVDIVKDHELFRGLPSGRWYGSNASAAYNSHSYLKRSSDMAVDSLLHLLQTGEDEHRVV